MRKFLVKEDIIIFSKVVLNKDEVIELNDVYHLEYDESKIPLNIDSIINDKRFKEIIEQKQELNFDVQELTEEEDLEVKKFRIQLDVTTNRKKLREIENFMRKTLEEML